ncbi:MAG: hypothetical protein U0946_05920, partial [Patescibacteria group bacterium]|nr:hypothetical protein [Patescibacteria group bacterium]
KLKGESPETYKDFEQDHIQWLKNWLLYNIPSSRIVDFKLGNKSLGFKILTGKTKVVVFYLGYGKRFGKKEQKELKNTPIILINDAQIQISKKTVKVKISFKDLKGAKDLLAEINKKVKRTIRKDNPVYKNGKQEHHFARFIADIDHGRLSLISRFEFKMEPTGEYWRTGFLLGQISSNNYEQLGTTGFPLIHLHKDTGNPNLKLTTYINGKHPPDVQGKDLGLVANATHSARLEIYANDIIRLFVDNKPAYSNIINKKFLSKMSILSWSDQRPEYQEPKILSYSYDVIS